MELNTMALTYWVEFLFGLVATVVTTGLVWMWRRFRAGQKEQDNIKKGIEALLRDRIIQAYNHYNDKGYCPIYAMENVHSMFEEYKELGGNGTVARLVTELEVLPTNKPPITKQWRKSHE